MLRRINVLVVVMAAVLAASCATKTARPTVDRAEVKIQSEHVRELALRHDLEYKDRLYRLSYSLLHANADLCGRKTVRDIGADIDSTVNISGDWRDSVAKVLGITSTQPAIFAVAPGSPADKAGLRPGDTIISYNGRAVAEGDEGLKDLRKWMSDDFRHTAEDDLKAEAAKGATGTTEKTAKPDATEPPKTAKASKKADETVTAGPEVDVPATRTIDHHDPLAPVSVQLGIRRRGLISYVTVQAEAVCNYSINLTYTDEVNACADGKAIWVNTGLIRLVTDDNFLAVIIAHELAHNVMGHIEESKKNIGLGQIADALVEFITGVPSGAFTQAGIEANALSSISHEEEADYVGLYFTARAGLDISRARELWELMSVEHPDFIGRPGTDHPMDAHRSLFMDKTVAEINAKRAKGLPIIPNIKQGAVAPWAPKAATNSTAAEAPAAPARAASLTSTSNK